MSFRNVVTAILFALLITLISASVCFAADSGNLVAHYKFDGDYKDSSGNGNDGTDVGDVTFADDGVFGKSAVFNGGFLNVQSTPALNLGSKFTISVWVKVDPSMKDGNKSGPIVSKRNDGYQAYTQGTHGAGFHGFFTGGERSVVPGGFEDFGLAEDWSFLVFSFDGQALYLYHNGVLKATKPCKAGDSLKPSEDNMRIGTGQYSAMFKGKMDDLRIYDNALSFAEIKALYNAAGSFKNKIVLQLGKTTMMVDDKQQEVDPGRKTAPTIVKGRTLVPIRAIIEAMGGTIGWTQSEKRVDLTLKSKQMQLWIGRTTAELNGTQLAMDVPPMVMNERTMLPLRFVSENLGCKTEWDGKTQKVTIHYSK